MTSVKSHSEMISLGQQLGARLRGGEVIELVGDVGAGKTTFVKGLGRGLGIDEDIQSPSFTISRIYRGRDDTELHHYDFYRLQDGGVMAYELAESFEDDKVVTVVEWAETIGAVLPSERCRVTISYTPDGEGRNVSLKLPRTYDYLEVTT